MSQRMIEMILFLAALLLAILATHAYLVSRGEEQKLQATLASQNQIISDANKRQQQRDSTLASTLAEVAKQKAVKQSPQELADVLAKVLALPQPIRLVPAGISSAGPASQAPSTIAQSTRNPVPKNLQYRTTHAASSPKNRVPATDPGRGDSSALPDASGLAPAQSPGSTQGASEAANPPSAALCQPSSKCAGTPQDADLPAVDLKPLYNFALDCRACQAQLAAAKQNAADDAATIVALSRERDAAVTAAKGGTWVRRLRRNLAWFAVGAAVGVAASYAAPHR